MTDNTDPQPPLPNAAGSGCGCYGCSTRLRTKGVVGGCEQGVG